jgi:hypothetical protein
MAAKQLFGRPLRPLLANWILDLQGESFYLQQAQDAMRAHGQAASGVADALRTFVRHDMLQEVPDQRRVYFTALVSPYWAAFRAIAIALGYADDADDRSSRHAAASRRGLNLPHANV